MSGDGKMLVGGRHGDYPGSDAFPLDASFDGSVSVGWQRVRGGGYEAYRRVNKSNVGLGDLPGGGIASRATSVSADGNTVVGFGSVDDGIEPFRWTEDDGMISLGVLPGASVHRGQALDVSRDGIVVVGASQSVNGSEAFRWTPTTGIQALGDLPGGRKHSSAAFGVSADGSTIVGRASLGLGVYTSRAFIWTENHGMRNLHDWAQNHLGLDLQGVTLHSALSASANGRVIVGTGTKLFGTNIDTVAWRLVIPEPASLTMALTIALAATPFRLPRPRRRRAQPDT